VERSFFHFVALHACDRQTDGQTDRISIAIRRLHYMQRGKNPSLLVIHSFVYTRLIEKVVRTQLNIRIQHKTSIR